MKKKFESLQKQSARRCGAEPKSRGQRKALAADPDLRSSNVRRLRRIEGQIRGLQKMVGEDRYCAEIMVQIASVQEALRGVSRNLMRNHLRHCASHAIRSGQRAEAEKVYDEILNLMDLRAR
jgi:DNA-binding FrmR family transcriptional regulator